MVLQRKAKIIYQKKLAAGYFRCSLIAPDIACRAKPGQFLEVRLNGNYDPLLRRPFSIHRISGPNVEILYEVLGRGTEILSQKRLGEYLDVIGPLGNGFGLNRQTASQSIIVAGGMGVAPLIFLAEKLMKHKAQSTKHKALVLIGARTKSKILCEREFKALGFQVQVATDDGSRGFKGKVTELLKKLLPTNATNAKNATNAITLYACGPKPMLKEISKLCVKHNIPGQVSLEEHMACGIGVCLGCVVKTKKGYQRVCVDGPVFDAGQIIW